MIYMPRLLSALIITLAGLQAGAVDAAPETGFADNPKVKAFAQKMVRQHAFSYEQLMRLFADLDVNQEVLRLIKPKNRAENQPSWKKYRSRFLSHVRVSQGISFWRRNAKTLAAAREHYGVPEAIIVAIIGVETAYGRITGRFDVLESLATLAFYYPRRSRFFSSELENFLLLCRENKLSPHEFSGSFAGAIGIPQFMPGSQRRHAVDFDGDGKVDLRFSVVDAIGSVASFLVNHGWRRNEAITVRAEVGRVSDARLHELEEAGNRPSWGMNKLHAEGVRPASGVGEGDFFNVDRIFPNRASVLTFPTPEQETQYWLGFENFYVLTRYNRANFYAMSVFQLAETLALKQALWLADNGL